MKKENIMRARKTFTNNGRREEKIVYGLEDGEEQYYKVLGIGCGVNLLICFHMGANHKENFWERVFAYRIIPNEDLAKTLEQATGEIYITAQFFELGQSGINLAVGWVE